MDAITTLTLWYGDLIVGYVRNAIVSDDTWYGVFEPHPKLKTTELGCRVADYMYFCQQWNEALRTDTGSSHPSDFEAFADIVSEGLWKTELESSAAPLLIEQAPVFFVGGEVSFRLVNEAC